MLRCPKYRGFTPEEQCELADLYSGIWVRYRTLEIAAEYVLSWVWKYGGEFFVGKRQVDVYIDNTLCATLVSKATEQASDRDAPFLAPSPFVEQEGVAYTIFSDYPVSVAIIPEIPDAHGYPVDKGGEQIWLVNLHYSTALARVFVKRLGEQVYSELTIAPPSQIDTKKELEEALNDGLETYSPMLLSAKETGKPHYITAGYYGLFVKPMKKKKHATECKPYELSVSEKFDVGLYPRRFQIERKEG